MASVREEAAPRTGSLGESRLGVIVLGLVPLALLAVIVYLFAVKGSALMGPSPVPPDALQKVQIEYLVFRPNRILAYVRNAGPEALSIAQVTVNEHLWPFTVTPAGEIPRLGRATIELAFPWVETEPHEIAVFTNTGLKFARTVDIVTETPEMSAGSLATFGLLGVYAGVIPVVLGILWFPFLRRLGRTWSNFFLSVTAGLAIFLGVDALKEGFEVAIRLAGAFQGVALLLIGVAVGLAALIAVGQRTVGGAKDEASARLALAYMIAAGIGLHNLGEGLAIGAAYVLGKVALGAFLVIGFTLQNITEGLGIVAPLAKARPRLTHFVWMAAIAGVPTILGTWIGGFTYSDIWATLFLALGAGAILQVAYEIFKLIGRDTAKAGAGALNYVGLVIGLLVMYVTGLVIKT
jgi:zinc transporter ZupT